MSETDVTIKTLTDGPLEVSGAVEILASDGTLIKATAKSYLCRCGFSEKKPFCDGAHKREGFTAP
jgi:CDGSH-type Zn-finger protein